MTKETFSQCVAGCCSVIEAIRQSAHQLHADVNQHYDGDKPYGFHLDMVASSVFDYGHEVCADECDLLPLFFGAYYHDSIEDARLTYNDVRRQALLWMDERQALMASEIVYALTNDKGRTRQERAGDHYYSGIRETPYAPFVKLADRLANTRYSFRESDQANTRMRDVYREEMSHFLQAITVDAAIAAADCRFSLPKEMLQDIARLLAAHL